MVSPARAQIGGEQGRGCAAVHDPGGTDRGGEGQSRAKRLAEGHDVGRDAVGGECVQDTRAPETYLDLVKNQGHTVLLGGLPHAAQEAIRGKDDAAV